MPAYPYGPARWYKQSNKGLYGGQRIQSGNNVSGNFNTKTRRTFQVNVLSKRLWSHALDRFVQMRVSARTLRTIDRVGGLDEYLLGEKAGRIKQLGVSGWWLRWAIMQQPEVKKRLEKERWDLGLASKEEYANKLEELEKGNVGADLEQAYAALPDEGEADAMAAVGKQELADKVTVVSEAAEEDADADDVFAVENPPDLPPLKFRVEPRKHVVLTPNGWTRTKPFAPEYSKKWIREHKFPNYVADRMAAFEPEFEKTRESMPEMTLMEEEEILRTARRMFLRELEEKVDVTYEEQRSWVMEKKDERRQRSLEAKEQESEEEKETATQVA